MESRSASWPGVDQVHDVCEAEEGRAAPGLIHGAWVQAEHRGVQTGGGVTEVRFFYPQEGGAVLALLALVVVAVLEAHQQQGDEEDGEDGERVEEDEVEEGIVGAHHGMDGRVWKQRNRIKKVLLLPLLTDSKKD